MLIAQVLWDDRFGGPHNRIFSGAELLKTDGIQTLICMPDSGGNAAKIARERGLTVESFDFQVARPSKQILGALVWLLRIPFDTFYFFRFLRRMQPDVVHISSPAFVTPGLAARILRIPIVWDLNDTLLSHSIAKRLGSLIRWLAATVLAQGDALGAHYGLSTHEYRRMYAPVNVDKFKPAPRTVTSNELRIGLLANWNWTKGIDVFLRSAAHVCEKFGDTDIRLVLAGSKLETQLELARQLEDLVFELGLENKLTMLGFVSNPAATIESLDILVMAARAGDACPNVILEAMACGVPVVATDIGCVKELVTPEGTPPAGIVVPRNDVNAMSLALESLINDKTLRLRMGSQGRRLATDFFSLQQYVESHAEVYNALK